MKEINKYNIPIKHIRSEPGDGTSYEYYVFKDNDYYRFFPAESRFTFPQSINKWKVLKDEDYSVRNLRSVGMPNDLLSYSDKYNSNPWTVAECFRTIQEIENESNE